jgi:hypothetical protein
MVRAAVAVSHRGDVVGELGGASGPSPTCPSGTFPLEERGLEEKDQSDLLL